MYRLVGADIDIANIATLTAYYAEKLLKKLLKFKGFFVMKEVKIDFM
ncbi:MAG: hypothetical protein PG977_000990 [Bartonella clarridgeiae]|nr:MAG: hypothetical protein PG977_000990 [Bartonella clarridgeiae]